jgi:hypothetical protein
LTAQTDIIFTKKNDFDISYGEDRHGFIWSELKLMLSERQQQWQKLDRTIISSQSVPSIVKNALNNINDNSVRQHLQEHIDGQNWCFYRRTSSLKQNTFWLAERFSPADRLYSTHQRGFPCRFGWLVEWRLQT